MIGLLLAAAVTVGAGGAPSCADLNRAIENEEKELSNVAAQDIGDNSAPRSTVRQGKAAVAVGVIQANIALLGARGCPVYPHPISASAYIDSAIVCATAMTKLQTDMILRPNAPTPALPAACDETAWTRKGP